jgi:hypothetical protein
MTHEIIQHQCDFCGRKYSNKNYAQKHESNKCFWNPSTESCVTCEHLIAFQEDQNWLEFGKVVSLTQTHVTCEENHGMEFEEGKQIFTYQTHCKFWKKRISEGTYKFGKVFIRLD